MLKIIAFLGIAATLFYKLFEGNSDISEPQSDKIDEGYLEEALLTKERLSLAKGRAKRKINKIIQKWSNFKIGKTGQPDGRMSSYEYKRMFLLFASKSPEVISAMEAYLNNAYIEHFKNDNQKGGSAGKMKSDDGYYFVYVVVR